MDTDHQGCNSFLVTAMLCMECVLVTVTETRETLHFISICRSIYMYDSHFLSLFLVRGFLWLVPAYKGFYCILYWKWDVALAFTHNAYTYSCSLLSSFSIIDFFWWLAVYTCLVWKWINAPAWWYLLVDLFFFLIHGFFWLSTVYISLRCILYASLNFLSGLTGIQWWQRWFARFRFSQWWKRSKVKTYFFRSSFRISIVLILIFLWEFMHNFILL
mgnify:CR=1 FL=1